MLLSFHVRQILKILNNPTRNQMFDWQPIGPEQKRTVKSDRCNNTRKQNRTCVCGFKPHTLKKWMITGKRLKTKTDEYVKENTFHRISHFLTTLSLCSTRGAVARQRGTFNWGAWRQKFISWLITKNQELNTDTDIIALILAKRLRLTPDNLSSHFRW